MRLQPCNCQDPRYVREPRTGWMRWLLPSLRHWSCLSCDTRFLASKGAVAARLASHMAHHPDSVK